MEAIRLHDENFKVNLGKLTVQMCLDEHDLSYRMYWLNHCLENTPTALAQKVEIELIKNLKRNAPWLIPTLALPSSKKKTR